MNDETSTDRLTTESFEEWKVEPLELDTNVKQEIQEEAKIEVFPQFSGTIKDYKDEYGLKFSDVCTTSELSLLDNIKNETVKEEEAEEFHITNESIKIDEHGNNEEVLSILHEDVKIKEETLDDYGVTEQKTALFDEDSSASPNLDDQEAAARRQLGSQTKKIGAYKKSKSAVKCDLCDYQTVYKNKLKKHVLGHKNPAEIGTFTCDQCDFQTVHRSNLRVHYLRHKDAGEVSLKCNYCDFKTIYKNNLKTHLIKHLDPQKRSILKCEQCDYETYRKHNLNRHLLQHRSLEELKCYQCNFKTSQRSYLIKHLSRHRLKEEEGIALKCNKCEFETFNRKDLAQHILGHKSKEGAKVYKCDKCQYGTTRRRQLRTHYIRHLNPQEVQRYQCDKCPYEAVIKSNLNRHRAVYKH